MQRLAARLVMGEHLQVDASLVHRSQTCIAHIEQRADNIHSEKLFAIIAALSAGRKILLLSRQNEMLLQGDDFHTRPLSSLYPQFGLGREIIRPIDRSGL